MESKEDLLNLFSGNTENNKSQLDIFLEKMASEDENTSEEENMKGLRDDLNNMSLAEVLETLNSVTGEKQAQTEEEMTEEQAYEVLSNVTASDLIHAVSDSDEMAKEAEEEFGDVDLSQYSALEFLEALGENAEGEEKTAEDGYNEFYNMGRAYMEGAMSIFDEEKTAEEDVDLNNISAAEYLELMGEMEKEAAGKKTALKELLTGGRKFTRRGRASTFHSGANLGDRAKKEIGGKTSLQEYLQRLLSENRGIAGAGAGGAVGGLGAGYAAGRTKKAETLDNLTLEDISAAELLELLDNYNG